MIYISSFTKYICYANNFDQDHICQAIKIFLLTLMIKKKEFSKISLGADIKKEYVESLVIGNKNGFGLLQLFQDSLNQVTTYEIYLSKLLSHYDKNILQDMNGDIWKIFNNTHSITVDNIKIYLQIYFNIIPITENEKKLYHTLLNQVSKTIFNSVYKIQHSVMYFIVNNIINNIKTTQKQLYEVSSFLEDNSYKNVPLHIILKFLISNIIQNIICSNLFDANTKLIILKHLLLIAPHKKFLSPSVINPTIATMETIYKNSTFRASKLNALNKSLEDIFTNSTYYVSKEDINLLLDIFKQSNCDKFRVEYLIHIFKSFNEDVLHNPNLTVFINDLEKNL